MSSDFRQTAIQNRYLLLLALRTIRKQQGSGAANTAYEITQESIKRSFVEQREAPAGEMLERWIKNRNPPAWPLKGAAILLAKEPEYSPHSEAEKAGFALTFAEAMPDSSWEELYRELCPGLKTKIGEEIMQQACENRR